MGADIPVELVALDCATEVKTAHGLRVEPNTTHQGVSFFSVEGDMHPILRLSAIIVDLHPIALT
jgi:hypothetical protein